MTNSPAHLGVDIRLLGPVSVAVDGREVTIGSPKQRTVLAMLALSRRAGVDALSEALWRESPPASVAATIHTLVSRLRRTLEDPGGGITIRSESGGYLIEMEPDHLDVNRFHDLVALGRRAAAEGSWSEAADHLRRALSLWRGPALADLPDHDFARVASVRLESARLGVAEDLADVELNLGRPAGALAVLEPLVAEHPFREDLRQRQMLALYRLGRQAEALAAYQELRKTLAVELGLEPAPALQSLEREILLQSPNLDGHPTQHRQHPDRAGIAPLEPLSSGTLAFLFTDIEASTSRWEGNQAAMASDLARHDAVLRSAVESHEGRVFAHTGDGIGAAFPTAAAALAASVAGQRALGEIVWDGNPPLKVRVAIHAGAAEARAGTFLGPTLNRTARLLDEARGGEIVCSQAAADLARDDLPADVALVQVGERRLEGLARPETLWQVVHPELAQLPPAAARRAAGVPRARTSLVGRETELAELCAALAETRLLTITGLGGVGKTRLALEVASRVEQQFAQGACVVELAHLRDERLIAGEILSALGVVAGPADYEASEERLYEVLADRHLLLILDNCEQVLDAVARTTDGLLRRTEHVTVVATSREVLSVPGETAWRAPGLSLPPSEPTGPDNLEHSDAAALFVLRARAVQPGFGITAANAGAIARICRRLDGIPLALELAAAKAKVLSVNQLAERLDKRFRLLVGGPRSVASRHQTLRAAMDWSFELLPEGERQLLRRFSVFTQSFDLDAAAATVGDDADPLDVLEGIASLIDKSLMVPEGTADTARYRLLETVRQYGAERLHEAGEELATRVRHRRHFVERIHTAWHTKVHLWGDPWVRIVALDRENYHAALEDAAADGDMEAASVLIAGLHYTWYWQGSPPAVMDTIDADAIACSNPSLHAEALTGLAGACWVSGRIGLEAVRALIDRAREVADTAGTRRDQGWTRYNLGYFAGIRGEQATARAWMVEALELLRDEPAERSWADYQLGWSDMADGDVAGASHHFHTALATLLAEQPGDEVRNVHFSAALALAKAAGGDGGEGFRLARQAVEAARGLGIPGLVTMTLVRAAQVEAVASSRGAPDIAEALRRLREQRSSWWVSDALALAALAHEAQGRPELAAHLLGGAAGVAASLASHSPPVLAGLLDRARHRLVDVLGPERMAEHEAAGRATPVPRLLEIALAGVDE